MKMLNKNFVLVLIGQIISLFGNAILRFALPLYLLNKTGSASLFGIVSACAFIPMIIATPIGGILADRINKRNIMVILDFTTALLMLIFTISLGKVNLIFLLLITLFILYTIQGVYQPAVQSSIPVLVPQESMMQANSMINLVSSLSGLIGPILGGVLYGLFGIEPLLIISIICFTSSAIMEIFIKIPYAKTDNKENIFTIAAGDLKESFEFILNKQPEIFKVAIIIAAVNLLLSSCAMIGLPVIVTQKLNFDPSTANTLYGYMEGIMGTGSLIGAILAGVIGRKLDVTKLSGLLLICTLTLVPMSIPLYLHMNGMVSYVIIGISGFFMMLLASFFSVQIMTYLQLLTPVNLLGKIISCAMCIGMCATPIGQALYGILFQKFAASPQIILSAACILTIIVSLMSRKVFDNMSSLLKLKQI